MAGDSGVLATPGIVPSQRVGRARTSPKCPHPRCPRPAVPKEGRASGFRGLRLQHGTGLLRRDALHPGPAHRPLAVSWLLTHGVRAGAAALARLRQGFTPAQILEAEAFCQRKPQFGGAGGVWIRPLGSSIPRRGAPGGGSQCPAPVGKGGLCCGRLPPPKQEPSPR